MEKGFVRWDGVDERKPSLKIGWPSERMQNSREQIGSCDQMKGRWNNKEVQGMSSAKGGKPVHT